jgi:hypothetical protein
LTSLGDAALAITNLIFRYEEAMDEGDFRLASQFMADAVLTREGHPGQTTGRDFEETYSGRIRIHDDGTPRTRHVVSNVIVEIALDGLSAMARSYFTVFQQVPHTLPLQPVAAGRYEDAFALSEDGWRFTRRHAITQFVGEVGQLFR